MNHQLDDRLRALGTHLDAERAEWSGDAASPYAGRAPRSGGRSRMMLVAASVVLVAGVGGVLATRDRGDAPSTAAGADTTAASTAPPMAESTTVLAPTTVAAPATTVATPSAAERLAAYTGWYLPTSVPAGFEITNLDASVPVSSSGDTGAGSNGIVLNIGLRRDASYISISVSPNTDGTTLGEMVAKGGVTTKVGSRDGVILESGDGNVSVVWFDAGLVFSVSGRAPSAEVLAVAAGLAPATPEQIIAADQAITTSALALGEIDATTLADGTQVSVRGTAATGAEAICLMGDAPRCVRQISEAALGGEVESAIFQRFVVGDERALVGWHEGPDLPTTAGVETVAGRIGVFVRATVTDLNNPPQITFDDGDGPPFTFGVASGTDDIVGGTASTWRWQEPQPG